MKWLFAVLLGLLVLLQYKLWFGDGNLSEVYRLRHNITIQQQKNNHLLIRNQALAAEVTNLKRGTAAIGELARSRLGMIRKGDTFFQYISPSARGARNRAD